MKIQFIKLLALFLFLLSCSKMYCSKWIPDYSITSDVLDVGLKKTETQLLFSFLNSDRKSVITEIKLGYNKISETIIPDAAGNFKLNLKPGKYVFRFYLNLKHSEIETDTVIIKSQHLVKMEIRFRSSEIPVIALKPVIYFYPQQTTTVSVKLDIKGKLGFTYPRYNNGWNFTVDKGGIIHMADKTGERKHSYLFWDGIIDLKENKITEGFIVNKNELVNFFEEKLNEMGLNAKESEDFITFWCPQMNVNEKSFVRFLFNEQWNEYAKLSIEPKPDKLFRVFMLWSPMNEKDHINFKEQKIESVVRDGFTVIEWGGAEIKNTLY